MERYNRELQHLADQLQRHRHLQTVIEQLRQQQRKKRQHPKVSRWLETLQVLLQDVQL